MGVNCTRRCRSRADGPTVDLSALGTREEWTGDWRLPRAVASNRREWGLSAVGCAWGLQSVNTCERRRQSHMAAARATWR